MPSPSPSISRRRSLLRLCASSAALALPLVWTGARAQAPRPLRPTPSQTEGPYYPVRLPDDSDADLLRHGSLSYPRGRPAWVEGDLLDVSGRPLSGAVVEIWQCDDNGHYHHPGDGDRADRAFQGFGQVTVDAQGRWRFRTIRPVAYGSRAPHIHLKVKLGRRELLTTQLYAAGDPGNARDFIWSRLDDAGRAALTQPYVPVADGLRAQYSLVVAA